MRSPFERPVDRKRDLPGGWKTKGNCLGSTQEAYFPLPGIRPTQAKKVCENCPVKQECLEDALINDSAGVWGGMTESERKRLKKNLIRPAKAAGRRHFLQKQSTLSAN